MLDKPQHDTVVLEQSQIHSFDTILIGSSWVGYALNKDIFDPGCFTDSGNTTKSVITGLIIIIQWKITLRMACIN